VTAAPGLRETGSVRIGRTTFSPAAVGWTMVAAIATAIASVAVAASLGSALYGMPVAIAFGLTLVHAAAIPVALLRPVVAALAAAIVPPALSLAAMGGQHAPWPWAVTTMVTQAIVVLLVAVQERARFASAAWVVSVVGTIAVWIAMPRDADESAVNIIVAASTVGAALVVGMVVREWRSVRGQLTRERALSAEEHEHRMIAEEKTRIARELHDVVAHNMSIINVRATTAAYRYADVPAPVVAEFDEIAAEARNALAELRRLLGVLRAEDAEQELAPQPGLADIAELVRGTERSGADVTLTWEVERTDDIGSLASLAAYRITQEALSNALRHAPGARIVIACEREGETLELSVTNGPPAAPAVPGEPGHGIVGMRERALGVGGSLEAGATPDGGYAVRATLPLRETEGQAPL
jgi:signal transduction histidine kinase